ncbi:class I SAM-dependent methyltransferase [Nodosilinea sp. LEGE 07088]|uniref:class I SAM-dependent methyltransferase n=1 Tax=Nodosilinea sp. LEGE 07088 TaxID=2777968 RepID=UPI001881CEF8|nr:class I SAM-dependent methyltransferase [Nodosilinea sp. LEGE 07088]MBE9138808.1 class I SAM-dependent methyltransferase [Nodosilinea sp. LEGE 07088]
MVTPRQLKELYDQGENISSLLRKESLSNKNTEEIIEISYDLQSGSYISSLDDKEMAFLKRKYAAEVTRIILSLCPPSSVLEAGVGEATTLAEVVNSFPLENLTDFYGFDLCWSRVAHAQAFLEKNVAKHVTLCTGSLFQIPFSNDSIDVVYTSHSIEPNGGSEIPILKELYRVARKFIILLEPGYEFASNESKKRMIQHGYCRDLKLTIESLGWKVLKHDLFPYSINPLNPTAITIIQKETIPMHSSYEHVLACPKFKTPLTKIGDALFSPEGLCVYPILGGVPCLRAENSVIASHFPKIMMDR